MNHARHGRAATFSPMHVVALFVFYMVVAFCVLTFTFYYVFNRGELRLVTGLALVFSIVATFIHVKAGRRDRVDDLIDKGP